MPALIPKRVASGLATASVAVVGDDALARRLSLPAAAEHDADAYDFLVRRNGERLELHDRRDPQLKPLHLDFSDLELRPYAAGLSRRQPLARAIGKVNIVADATAGLAQDALRLALMGYHVTAIERSPVVAALVDDALRHVDTRAVGERLQLRTGDARALLPALAPRPETIYLDPMFPSKRRQSSAVRKEIKWLRDLVGDDVDALELFDIARRAATYRVVVKRPDHAPPLAPDPAGSISGKLVRYDIYSTRTT
jgi:16S rRNA (guanine1516-N2)-methyltransferase